MHNYRNEVVEVINDQCPDLGLEEIDQLVEIPPSSDLGDFAFPCFSLAKTYRKNPAIIAQEMAEKINNPLFDKVETKGAYLNFFINKEAFTKDIFQDLQEKKDTFGKINYGENKTIVLEYSSPNIAKPFHIGHIRTTVIGDSLKRISDFLGYKTVAINHLGDYGTQFGMMIEAYLRWGDRDVIEKNPIPELVKLYVRINEEAKENPELLDNARNWFVKLENKDPKAVELWEWFREVSLEEFQRVYNLLDIHFDYYTGESFYSPMLKDTVDLMEEKGVLTDSQGARIVDFGDELPPAIIIKKDGSSIYLTRDMATALYRKKEFDFYKSIYVVGSQQSLHFQQLKAILKKMGYDWEEDMVHVAFGMVSLKEGTMSTRKGKVVYLEDVLNKAIQKVDDILKEREEDRGQKIEDREKLAQEVGIGAIKFQELFNQRIKDYVFDWDQTLSFEGETGPYVQYTHARICSLLKKGDFKVDDSVDEKALSLPEEQELLMKLSRFSDVVIDAHEKHEPYFITRYITDLAKTFNKYYTHNQINTEDTEVKKARLLLSYGIKVVLAQGLSLLGIQAPEKM